MDIFNHFISNHNENTPKFSEIFNSINELKLTLDDKSYVLEHYLSMFFHLIKQMDFTYLQKKSIVYSKNLLRNLLTHQKNFTIKNLKQMKIF